MLGMNWIHDYLKAGNPETPKSELALLAHNNNDKIRMRVAENNNTSPEVLQYLAQDNSTDVRLAVATNSSVPQELIYILSRDPDPSVRHGIAEDPHMPYDVLRKLADDDNPYVSCRARKTLEALDVIESQLVKSDSLLLWPSQHNRQRFA